MHLQSKNGDHAGVQVARHQAGECNCERAAPVWISEAVAHGKAQSLPSNPTPQQWILALCPTAISWPCSAVMAKHACPEMSGNFPGPVILLASPLTLMIKHTHTPSPFFPSRKDDCMWRKKPVTTTGHQAPNTVYSPCPIETGCLWYLGGHRCTGQPWPLKPEEQDSRGLRVEIADSSIERLDKTHCCSRLLLSKAPLPPSPPSPSVSLGPGLFSPCQFRLKKSGTG